MSQHIVDFIQMQFFLDNHLSGVFLQKHGIAIGDLEQVVVTSKRGLLVLQTLAKYVADVVFFGLQQRTDLWRRVATEQGDQFPAFCACCNPSSALPLSQETMGMRL